MKTFLSITLWAAATAIGYTQNLSFTQFNALRTVVNPAYVSAHNGAEAIVAYRSQWRQTQGGVQGGWAGANARFCRFPLGVGAFAGQWGDDFIGYRHREAGMLMGGFFGNPRAWTLHGALQASATDQRVDYERLVTSGQLDPIFGVQPGSSSPVLPSDGGGFLQTFEVGIGAVLRTRLKGRIEWPFSIGGAVHALSGSRDASFLRVPNRQPARWTGHFSLAAPLSERYKNSAVAYLNIMGRVEGTRNLSRANLGFILQYNGAHIGTLYQFNQLNPGALRNTHQLAGVVGWEFEDSRTGRYALQYSFDGVLSGLGQTATGGAHELSLVFSWPKSCLFKPKTGPGRSYDCYDFDAKRYKRFL